MVTLKGLGKFLLAVAVPPLWLYFWWDSRRPKWCGLCGRMIQPRKHFSWGTFLVLLLLGGFPAFVYVAYYFCIKQGQCPICDNYSLGRKPKEQTV